MDALDFFYIIILNVLKYWFFICYKMITATILLGFFPSNRLGMWRIF